MPSVSDLASPAVAVVILNYNGLADTEKCLESLRAIRYPRLSVIVVDNGSDADPTDVVSKTFPHATLIKTGENLGYAGGNNRGIAVALESGADFVLVLNNDTTVSPDIVEALLAAFATNERLGIVGPVINYMEDPDTVMTDGVRFNPGPGTEFFQRIVVSTETPELVPVDIVNGCCMMFRANVLQAIGAFDESFFIVHEESDLCLRARRAGFTCAVLGRSLVRHKGSSSFDRSGRRFQRYFDTRNLYFLLRRHAGHVGTSRSFAPSLWHYWRYASYRYEIEAEAGKMHAARAVAEGVRDALASKTGPYVEPTGLGTAVVHTGLRALHQLSRARRLLVGLVGGASNPVAPQ